MGLSNKRHLRPALKSRGGADLESLRLAVDALWSEIENLNMSAGDNSAVFQAQDSLTFKVGSSTIEMKKDGTILISGKDITINGSGKVSVKATGDLVMRGSKISQN